MRDGGIVESGDTEAVINRPQHEYTRLLIKSVRQLDRALKRERPAAGIQQPPGNEPRIFELTDVAFAYRKKDVLGNINLAVDWGESLGIVGESGSGKSTLLFLLLRLAKARRGSVSFAGKSLAGMDRNAVRDFRMRVQPVFQDPFLSLDPSQKVAGIIGEPLVSLGLVRNRDEKDARIRRVLCRVGLSEDALPRHPAEFSGGQRQRIALARALVTDPEALIADEAVSALDVITKIEILNLLRELKKTGNFTLIFVSHDLPAVAYIAERIVVLDRGEIIEDAPAYRLLRAPVHPRTRLLVESGFTPDG
ncbi:MAG: ATP-binding cassette domain-containing protein [Spirochaetaceae bacterium]|nr:ATP-binding cassette domain-containing protein [Spirochaetaceae bacterium]